MKKALAVILVLALTMGVVFALSACGGKDVIEDASNALEDASGAIKDAAEDISGAVAGLAGDYETVEDGVLIMATNATFPPYEFIEGDDGAIIGIDAEIAALIAEKLGLELRIENVEFDSIIAGVQSGKYDMGMAGMTVTEERLQSINFTDSYATAVQSVIVREGSAIATVDDIAGDGSMKIGVQQGTTGAIKAADDYGEDNVINYKNGPDAVQALIAGKVDCVIIDNEPAKAYVAANEGLKILDTAYANEDYAICVAKEDTALLAGINTALNELIADGSVKAIIDKYIEA